MHNVHTVDSHACGRLTARLQRLAITATAGVVLLLGAAATASVATAAGPAPRIAAPTSAAPIAFNPKGVGTPATAVTPGGAQVVFWKGAANHLFEAWYAGSWNGPVDVSAAFLNNVALTSSPSVAVTPGGTQLVFWQGGQDLWEAWYDTTWHGPVDWSTSAFESTSFNSGGSPPVSSAPAVTVTRDGSAQLVFFSSKGALFEAYYTNTGWHGPVDIDGGVTNGQVTVALESAPSVAVTSDGSQYVVYRGPGNHLHEARYANGWQGIVDVTASYLGGADLLASAPSIASTSSNTLVVFWQGLNGHLDEAWAAPGWFGPEDWTASAFHGAQPLSSAPSVAVTPDASQTQIVFWEGAGSSLSEAWWNGAWNGPVNF
jgi:hypothetical protein